MQKKYRSFFRLRFSMGLQYRAAALAGVITQFVWGLLQILVYRAFYQGNEAAFPMTFSATVSYVWLQQAFLAFFAAWMMEEEIFDVIMNGNIAYELCRPIDLYAMWFSRSLANRLSKSLLRCFPILIIAAFLPAPYGLRLPASLLCFVAFLLTLILGLMVSVSFCMLIYVASIFTISPNGLRMLFTSAVEFFSGGVIPLPFFPAKLQLIMELLPFASMQNVPLRIYSGSMSLPEMQRVIFLQLVWLLVLIMAGKGLCKKAQTRAVVQGG